MLLELIVHIICLFLGSRGRASDDIGECFPQIALMSMEQKNECNKYLYNKAGRNKLSSQMLRHGLPHCMN